jgi:hypothetical protein
MITTTDKKHPYTKELQNTLNVAKKKCECLQKRLDLIESKYFKKHLFSFFISSYDRNEANLLKISTQNESAHRLNGGVVANNWSGYTEGYLARVEKSLRDCGEIN